VGFVRSFVRLDRWREWPLVVPIYDGRQCPECGALCVGVRARKVHQGWHTKRTEWDSALREAVRKLVVRAGLNVVELANGAAPDGIYDEDDDDYDERLTRKARAVVGGGGLDDEEDE
jgi:hypothetical protein